MTRLTDEQVKEMLAGLDEVPAGPWEADGTIVLRADADGWHDMAVLPDDGSDWPYAATTHIARCSPDRIRPILTELIAAREGGVKVRALEWKLREARSMIGLYSVRQLSENVWQTMWNGTEIARWSPTELLATSRAQSHYEAAIRSAIVTGEGE